MTAAAEAADDASVGHKSAHTEGGVKGMPVRFIRKAKALVFRGGKSTPEAEADKGAAPLDPSASEQVVSYPTLRTGVDTSWMHVSIFFDMCIEMCVCPFCHAAHHRLHIHTHLQEVIRIQTASTACM
jgi:hypothetical protein